LTDDRNAQTRRAWDANAAVWDARMGDEGNDFHRILTWPAVLRLLDPRPAQRILDAACGNGLTSRMLADLGAQVTAFDFSADLIAMARGRGSPKPIDYQVVDATDEAALLSLGEGVFDSALCNMALFDMAEIAPLFHVLPRLLKPGGIFVFSIIHPAFNNPSCVKLAEEWDDAGIQTRYAVKVTRYMSDFGSRGVALRDQPEPQWYFHRPLQSYLKLGFENGFVLDGFEERAFPPEHAAGHPLSWGGQFSEFPPVLVARMRLSAD